MPGERTPVARMLRPRSVAIVGASPDPATMGGAVLANFERMGYEGEMHFVSRSRAEIKGRPCVPSIAELPSGIDAILLNVPQAAVLESVAACVERRIGGAVIFASGFSEAGDEGRAKQAELAATAREGGLAIDGPNCLGFVNYLERVPLTFDHADPDLVTGSGVALIGQSGAMIGVIRGGLAARGIPMAFAISTGNEAVTSAEDFLAELVDDERIRMVVLFIEQIRRPRLFLELVARARAQGKPVVMMHPGRTARAQASAQSHTGALAGDYAVMRTVLQHHAVVVVDTLDELFDVAALLARWPEPPTLGAAVVTNSGAFRGVALDFSEEVDLDFPALQPATCDVIKAWFPPFAGVGNPLDIMTLGFTKPDIFGQASKALLDDPGIGSLIASFVAGAPNLHAPKSRSMLPVITASKKPVAFVMMGDEQPLTDEFRGAVRASAVPLFRSPERAMRAMASITRYGRSLQALKEARPEPAVLPVSLQEAGPVPEYRGKRYLAAAGIPMPEGALARSAREAQDIAARIGYPVVLKAQAAALTHKSDIGGVIVGISDNAELDAAWERMHRDIGRARPELALDGALVEQMAKPGLELFVGARRDPDWGVVLMVGLGGVWIEALEDVRLLAPSLDEERIVAELHKLKGARLLTGYRGAPPVDARAVANTVVLVDALMRATPRLAEIDINPLVAYPAGEGVLALDALMIASAQTFTRS